MPENEFVWHLITQISPGLVDGFGGINYRAIGTVFDFYGIERNTWHGRELFSKVLVFVQQLAEYIEEQKGK